MGSMKYRRQQAARAKAIPTPTITSPSFAALSAMLAASGKTPKKQTPAAWVGETYTIGDARELNDYLPGRSYHAAFSSLESFTRHVEGLDRSEAWDASGWEGGKEFHGTENMEETLKLAREGWVEGTEAVERARAQIKALRPSGKIPVQYGIVGSIPCIPRAVAGNIFNMRLPVNANIKKRPVFTLIANMSCLGYIGQEVMTNRAAVVATLIDEIEASGFACEVISTALSYGCNDPTYRMAHSVVLKRSDQPVDIFRMAFGLGHSSLFRRMVFADRGSSVVGKEKCGWGMGRSHGFEDFEDGLLASKDVYVIPSANLCHEKFETEEKAATEGISYLIHELRKQKCPAFPKLREFEGDAIVNEEDDTRAIYYR